MENKDSLNNIMDTFDIKKKQKAIFLDRDGVINIERSYIKDPEDFVLYDFTPEAILKINQSSYKAIVITNQSAIAQGISSLEELSILHKKMETELGHHDAFIDGLYFCPHHPDKAAPGMEAYKIDCDCRKPKPGMLLQAAKDFNIDLKQSIMIGDTQRDLVAGSSAGCYTAGVMCGHGVKEASIRPDYLFSDLLDASGFLTDSKNEQLYLKIKDESLKRPAPFIVGIAGTARSGKSNLASFLKMRFEQENQKVLKISLDDWLIPGVDTRGITPVNGKYRLLQLEKDLKDILVGRRVTVTSSLKHPNWNKTTTQYSLDNASIIIIEGAITLSTDFISDLLSYSIFTTTDEEKEEKRFKQLCQWKNLSENEIDIQYLTRVKQDNSFIEKDKALADIVVVN